MNIYILGGSGLIGKVLAKKLVEKGYKVFILTRKANTTRKLFDSSIQIIEWDGNSSTGWNKFIKPPYSIINLAGETINGRWTNSKKERIYKSRLRAVNAINTYIFAAAHKPETIIQSSAIGFYGYKVDEPVSEDEVCGQGFLAKVCDDVENTSLSFIPIVKRNIIIRTGIVLSPAGGVLPVVQKQMKLGFSGYFGEGNNWLSWIHINDEVNAIVHLLEHSSANGAFNLVAPNPVTWKNFSNFIQEIKQYKSLYSLSPTMVKLFFGQRGQEILLASQKLQPTRLLHSGFQFEFDDYQKALLEILSK